MSDSAEAIIWFKVFYFSYINQKDGRVHLYKVLWNNIHNYSKLLPILQPIKNILIDTIYTIILFSTTFTI